MKPSGPVAFVYTITCVPTGHVYVGASTREGRRKQHFASLRLGKHTCQVLQSLYNEHGVDAFAWEVVEWVPIFCGGTVMASIISEAERRWRNHYRADRPGLLIGSSASWNMWVAFPGWDGRCNLFARGVFRAEDRIYWRLLERSEQDEEEKESRRRRRKPRGRALLLWATPGLPSAARRKKP